jgi:hypothetical protein
VLLIFCVRGLVPFFAFVLLRASGFHIHSSLAYITKGSQHSGMLLLVKSARPVPSLPSSAMFICLLIRITRYYEYLNFVPLNRSHRVH